MKSENTAAAAAAGSGSGARTRVSVDLPEAFVEAVVELVLERLGELGLSASASPYLSVEEAAEFLRCDRQRIYDLLSARRLTKRKDGSRVLLERAELVAYVSGSVAPQLPSPARGRSRSGVAA